MSEPFIAEIKIFAGNFAPRGYAFCDGQLLPISQNTALFSLVGTTYGGDGRTTLGLPNLRDRAPMHPGNGPGLTSRRLGESGGTAGVTMTTANLPSHNHSVQGVSTTPPDTASPENAYPGAAPVYGDGSPAPMASDAVESAGSDTPDPIENRQPFLEMNFIIALTGIYPSRT
jgi:microcystin-dependent protein